MKQSNLVISYKQLLKGDINQSANVWYEDIRDFRLGGALADLGVGAPANYRKPGRRGGCAV